jgi:hypothetical protein
MEARLDDAERHSRRMLEIGTEIGEPDAFALYAAQLFVNRSFAGRYAEVIPLLEAALESTPDAMAYRAAHAISCSVSGREHDALAFLLDGLRSGFEGRAHRLDMDHHGDRLRSGCHRARAPGGRRRAPPDDRALRRPGRVHRRYEPGLHRRLCREAGVAARRPRRRRRSPATGARGAPPVRLDVPRGHHARRPRHLATPPSGTLDAQGLAWLDGARSIAAERGLAIVTKQVEQLRRSVGGDARV